jgi:hypothetical protein
MDYANGICTIRNVIQKDKSRTPLKVHPNKLGCAVFEYKILQSNGNQKHNPQHAHGQN